MRLILRAGRGLSKAAKILILYSNWGSAIFIIILMFLISADVTTRYLAARPIPGGFEIAQMLMVFIVFLALAQTLAERRHITVEVVTSRLSGKVRVILGIVACLAGILLLSLIVWKCGLWAWESWQLREYTQGIINVPLYPSKIALVVGSGLFCLQFVLDMAKHVSELRKFT